METQEKELTTPLEILIVEDSPTQAERLKFILEQQNFKVLKARHGKEALEMIREHQPDLVISDIIMPEMNGFELCQQIKADLRYKDIPVILLTSLSSMEDVMHGLKCGAENFITKPYNDNLLLTRIEYILQNRHTKQVNQCQYGIEIIFGGKKHFINSDPQQILSLLISTFESAVAKNQELEATNRELAKATTLLEKQAEELQALSLQDGLTGLYNRRGFVTLADHQIKVALRQQTPLFLMFADLDDLKIINDTYGHGKGDEALCTVANILQSTYRQSDIVARLGGDEFVVLHLCNSNTSAQTLLKRLEETVEKFNADSGHDYQLSLSVGFAWFDPNSPISLEDLLKEADEMMYDRKRGKKARLNGVSLVTPVGAGIQRGSEMART